MSLGAGVSRAQSRKHRGMRTQRALAERWVENGLFPFAVPQGAGAPGKDILNTPGLSVEVKARDAMSFPAAIRQATDNAEDGDWPIVVARHNGQGEKNMDKWTVTTSLDVFEGMLRLIRSLEGR